MKKGILFIASALLFGVILGGCTKQSPTVQEYYPIEANKKYSYQGTGMEFATFNVFIDFTSENKVQRRVNNGGTEVSEVVEVADGKVTCVYRQAETYYRENALDKESNVQDVLLMEPIKEGTSWTLSDGSVRTITGVSEKVETPSGEYLAVSVETQEEAGKTIEYYAKNIGLVKRSYIGADFEISSDLSEVLDDAPLVQVVRFYYPDINDGQIYAKSKEVTFHTNDLTEEALAEAYKEDFAGKPGDVFSPGTKINQCYLDGDGVVHLDLSREFLTEMNAGAAYEGAMLQCIANTFGGYYNQSKVLLTIDNALYSSGHFALKEGEYLTAKLEQVQEIR